MENRMIAQLITRSVIIEDPLIIRSISKSGAKYITCKKIVDKSKETVLQFNIDNSIYSSRYNYTLIASREGLKFTTPAELVKHRGKYIRVYQDVMEFEENELFRIKAVDFTLSKKERIRHDVKDPYFTKSGIMVIPKYYINYFLDKISPLMNLSFNDNNLKHFIDENLLIAYLTPFGQSGMCYPLYPCSNGLRTRTLVKLIDSLINKSGKKIDRFIYSRTVEHGGSKYGKMLFEYNEEK